MMPIKIHGKEYMTVAERVNKIHADLKSELSITTELVSWENDIVIMKATITTNLGEFTGHAYEDETRGQINKTSALENCETSAIGRALASAGYGGSEFASANEVQNAIHQQDDFKKMTAGAFAKKLAETKTSFEAVGKLGAFKKFLNDNYGTDNEVQIVKDHKQSANAIINGLRLVYKECK